MLLSPVRVFGALAVVLLLAVPAHATDVSCEIVRGRVTDDSLKPLAAARARLCSANKTL